MDRMRPHKVDKKPKIESIFIRIFARGWEFHQAKIFPAKSNGMLVNGKPIIYKASGCRVS